MMNPRMAAGNKNLIKFFQWLSGSNLAEQQQDQEYDQNHPDQSHAGMAMSVAITPDAAGEAAEQDDDQEDADYGPKRHAPAPRRPAGVPQNAPAARIKAYSGPRVVGRSA